MKPADRQSATPRTTPRTTALSHAQAIFATVFGQFGPLWAVAFTVLATLVRWTTDPWLVDASPFSFYYLSVVLTALLSRMGSAMLAVILGALAGQWLWVAPRVSLEFQNTSQIAQLVVFLIVATGCGLAVATARLLRIFDYVGTED